MYCHLVIGVLTFFSLFVSPSFSSHDDDDTSYVYFAVKYSLETYWKVIYELGFVEKRKGKKSKTASENVRQLVLGKSAKHAVKSV